MNRFSRFTGCFLTLIAMQAAPASAGSSAGIYSQRVLEIAASSSCAKVSWKDRGRAPAGYTKGVALSFARSSCRLKSSNATLASPGALMGRADTQNTSKDAIALYAATFRNLGMNTRGNGTETLRSLYTLGMGLGMRESSGKYCEGWDTSAGSNRPSSEAEAGPFQTSYNSIGASVELKKLYDEYRANPSRCFLEVFKEGASCKNQSILGSGAGAEYQKFSRSCPAFAAEYAMVTLRVLRKHFGPINRQEAQVNPSCNTMLSDVERLIDQDPNNACKELLN